MKASKLIFLSSILIMFSYCSWFVSDEQKFNITGIVVDAHLDSLAAHLDRYYPEENFERIIFLTGDFVNDKVANDLREGLRPNFKDIRIDSSHFENVYGTYINMEEKQVEYIKDYIDTKTGLSVYWIHISSFEVKSPKKISLYLDIADVKGISFNTSKWWLTKNEGIWIPESQYTVASN